MKRFINFMAAISVVVASLFAAYGCTESEDNGGGDGTYDPNVTFKASGAEFVSGDVILVTAYDASGDVVSTDVSYTYNGTSFAATSSYIVKEDSDEAYSYTATFSSTEVDSDGVFTVANDQSEYASYASSDLKTGAADASVISTPTLSFNNLMTKVVLNLSKEIGAIKEVSIEAKGKVTFDASAKSVTTTSDAAFAITPRRIESEYAYSCEFIVAPQDANDVKVYVTSTQTTDFKFETNDFTLYSINNINDELTTGSSYSVEVEMDNDAEISTGTLVSTTSSWSVGEEKVIVTEGILAEQGDDEYDVYLLIGQSNMVGYVYSADSGDEETRSKIGVWALDKTDALTANAYQFGNYSTVSEESTHKYGVADAFSETISTTTGRKVLIVLSANGGTAMSEWVKTSSNKSNSLQLFGEAVRRAGVAKASHGTLRGILWLQGEADLKNAKGNPDNVAYYLTDLKQLISDFRTDLGDDELPFIVGEILHYNENASSYDYDASPINDLLNQVGEEVAFSGCVSSEGLTSRGDNLHYNYAGAKAMGEGFAEFIYDYVYEGKLGY